MGFRTVVMLSNDHAHQWQNDPELGKKIAAAMNRDVSIGGYGSVVECVHGDCQTLAVLDGYTAFMPLSGKGWTRNESSDEVAIKLLKDAADRLGYRMVKKPTKK